MVRAEDVNFTPAWDTFVTYAIGQSGAEVGPDRPVDSEVLIVSAKSNPAQLYVSYIQFDISSFSGLAGAATLTLTVGEAYNDGWPPMIVYGLKDSYELANGPINMLMHCWNAPTTDPASSGDVVSLGVVSGGTYAPGSTITISGDAITSFVGDDTNNTLTFIMGGYAWAGPEIRLASMENTAYDGSVLTFRPLLCGDEGTEIQGDLNGDCYINLADFAIMAAQWQQCTDPANSACEY